MLATGILLSFCFLLATKESAQNESTITQKIVEVVPSITPEPTPTANQYQGIKISREELTRYLETTFTLYGIEDQIPIAKEVILCESGWNIHANNGISFGIAQFTPDTWHDYGYGDIFNPQSQVAVMAKMWNNNLQGRWDCYRMLK